MTLARIRISSHTENHAQISRACRTSLLLHEKARFQNVMVDEATVDQSHDSEKYPKQYAFNMAFSSCGCSVHHPVS